jgi:hypothetical protein
MTLINTLQLFPIPVLVYSLDRNLTGSEIGVIERTREDIISNTGNRISRTSYVLDEGGMEGLRADLTSILNNAFQSIERPGNICSLYITQSWVNYAKDTEFHHSHMHANSLYSAVVYLKTAPGDCIDFFRMKRTDIVGQLELQRKDYNDFNCHSWNLPVQTGTVIIFPSSLVHGVPPVNRQEERISLSFNSFIRGDLGRDEDRSALVL